MSYTIGSFNLLNFDMRSDDDQSKNLDRIADIIRNEKYDVIALQEIKSESYIKLFAKKVGLLNWKCCVKFTNGPSPDHNEGYAYLWNTSRLNMIGEPKLYTDNGVGKTVVRPPLMARFTPQGLPGGLPIEIRLINTHLAFNKIGRFQGNDVEYRRKEYETLINDVYPRVADKRYGNFMPAYTIMMGDYNLCIIGDSKIVPRDENKIKGYVISKTKDGRDIITVQSEKTSLKQVSGDLKTKRVFDSEKEANNVEFYEEQGDYYSQDYDHFSFEKDLYLRIGVLGPYKVDALKTYYNNDLKLYRKEVSDHVPIKIILDINGEAVYPYEEYKED